MFGWEKTTALNPWHPQQQEETVLLLSPGMGTVLGSSHSPDLAVTAAGCSATPCSSHSSAWCWQGLEEPQRRRIFEIRAGIKRQEKAAEKSNQRRLWDTQELHLKLDPSKRGCCCWNYPGILPFSSLPGCQPGTGQPSSVLLHATEVPHTAPVSSTSPEGMDAQGQSPPRFADTKGGCGSSNHPDFSCSFACLNEEAQTQQSSSWHPQTM